MFDFEFTTVRRFDGTNRTERAVEVFNTRTAKVFAVCRRRPFEAKDAWVARAVADAERRFSEEVASKFVA